MERGGSGQRGPPRPPTWLLFSHQTSRLSHYQHILAKPVEVHGCKRCAWALGCAWDAPAASLPGARVQTALLRAVTQPRPHQPPPAEKDPQLKPTQKFSQTCSKKEHPHLSPRPVGFKLSSYGHGSRARGRVPCLSRADVTLFTTALHPAHRCRRCLHGKAVCGNQYIFSFLLMHLSSCK